MQRRTIALTLSAGLLGLATIAGTTNFASAQPPAERRQQPPGERGQPGQPGERRGPGQQAPSVEAGMKGMNRAFKQLEAQITDASKKDENLRLLGDMQRGCVSAKNAMPRKIQEMKDEAARTKAAEKFRRDLILMTKKLLDAETSLMDGKAEAAKATLSEVVKMRDVGHKELGVEED